MYVIITESLCKNYRRKFAACALITCIFRPFYLVTYGYHIIHYFKRVFLEFNNFKIVCGLFR